MSQTRRHRGKLARIVDALLVVERADMKFVDDQFVPRREMEVVPLPVEARIVNDGVSDRVGHLTGVRVDALELALRRGQEEAIRIAGMSLGYVDVPESVLLSLHGMLGAVPVVERSDDGYSMRMGRPHAEGDSLRVQNRSHAPDVGFIAHGSFLYAKDHVMSLAIANAAAWSLFTRSPRPVLVSTGPGAGRPTDRSGARRSPSGSSAKTAPTSTRAPSSCAVSRGITPARTLLLAQLLPVGGGRDCLPQVSSRMGLGPHLL